MIGYIYITTNLINGKRYIGKRTKPEFDKNYFGSGVDFLKDFKKYGKSNFKCEILQECETQEELLRAERKWIEEFNAQESEEFYNIAQGGSFGNVTKGMSPERKRQWIEKITSKTRGQKRTEQQKAYMRECMIGVPRHFDKEKLSKQNSGKNNPMYGRKHKQSSKKLISEHNNKQRKTILIFDGKRRKFKYCKDCFEYINKNIVVMGKYLFKKLIRDGKPFVITNSMHTSDKEKFKKIEGMRILHYEDFKKEFPNSKL